MKNKKKEIHNLCSKKLSIINKLQSKVFLKLFIEEIQKKYKEDKDIIKITINEEIQPYIEELNSLKKETDSLNHTSIEDFFNNLKKKKNRK